MARNEVYKNADYLSLPVPTGTLSGAAVRVGGLNGVAQTNEGSVDRAARDSAIGGSGYYGPASPSSNEEGFASVALKGAFRLQVAGTGTLAVGAPVYITGANALTTVATDNQVFGHALSAKGNTPGSVIVRIAN